MVNMLIWIKIVFKILILLIALPFLLIYALVKHSIFKLSFKRHLASTGIDKNAIKSLSKELNLSSILKFSSKQ